MKGKENEKNKTILQDAPFAITNLSRAVKKIVLKLEYIP